MYLTREAFVRVEKQKRADEGSFWQEQKETTEEEAMRYRKDALGSLFSKFPPSPQIRPQLILLGRIGVKPIRSNALLLAQKKHGKAEINEKSLEHFSDRPKLAARNSSSKRDSSPSKRSEGSNTKGKKSAKNSDGEEEADEGSGDEAEKLDEEQMDEIDTIYRK